jgi:alpha-L-rhamnosidase-like protein/mannosylglycerate hydrolase MGH1-like protein
MLVGSDGLMVVDGSNNASWNLEYVNGRLTYVNAMYSLALQSAAKLATALGDRARANTWSRRADTVKDAVNRLLWNGRTGVYDGSVEQRGTLVQDANVTAILAGIPDLGRARSILKILGIQLATAYGPRTVSSPTPPGYTQVISPYMGGFHVMAQFASGEGASALSVIRQEWGYMIGHDPGGVTWERIQLAGRPVGGLLADSMAHAWSTGATAAMSQYVVGVMPTGPGYRRWSIAPRPGDLKFAQGLVPTPYGPITVRWERKKHKRFVLTTNAPRRTSGTVAMPFGRTGTIARNGKVVWSRGAPVGKTKARVVRGSVVFQESGKRATYAWVESPKKPRHKRGRGKK